MLRGQGRVRGGQGDMHAGVECGRRRCNADPSTRAPRNSVGKERMHGSVCRERNLNKPHPIQQMHRLFPNAPGLPITHAEAAGGTGVMKSSRRHAESALSGRSFARAKSRRLRFSVGIVGVLRLRLHARRNVWIGTGSCRTFISSRRLFSPGKASAGPRVVHGFPRWFRR